MFFIVSILLLVSVLWMRRPISLIWRFLGLVLLLISFFSVDTWIFTVTTRSVDFAWYERAPFKHLISLAFLVAGMASKVLYDAIESLRQRRSKGAGPTRLQIDHWDFVQPFLVAFIVFGTFWQFHGEESLTLTWLVLSYHNGFFWQTIIRRSGNA